MSSIKKQLDNLLNKCYNRYVAFEISNLLLKPNVKHLIFKLFSIINLYSFSKMIDCIVTMTIPC